MRYARPYVRIVNEQGEFIRLGAIYKANELPANRYVTYFDRNVKEFRLYVTDAANPYSDSAVWYYAEYKAKRSNRANISWAYITHATFEEIVAGGTTQTTAAMIAIPHRNNVDPNRVLVSTSYKPRNLLGRNAHYIGNSAEDEVLTFSANAKAISSGQFGQYPLYAFCRSSVWAMEVGSGDVAFSRISPVNPTAGIVGRNAVASIDGITIYASKDGVRTLPAMELSLSHHIQNSVKGEDDLMLHLNEETALGYFVDEASGRRELHVSTTNGIYAFSFEMRRWFKIDGTRRGFSYNGRALLGLTGGKVVKEGKGAAYDGHYRLAPLVMGAPDVPKRFRSIIEHSAELDFVRVQNVTDYEVRLAGAYIDHDIQSFDVMFEIRYAHRLRTRRKVLDIGDSMGYGGTPNLYKSAQTR